MSLRIGSLFSGYEGIGLALKAIWSDAQTVFVADVCKVTKDGVGHYEPHRAPCSILAHRLPGVPNLGDVSLIDWTPWRGLVDILTAGFPCQDVSTAGRRAGLKEGTRTGLWSQVVRAITELSPRLVVLENVPGIFTAPAAGDVEPCPWCVGDDPDDALRALDAVLADLAALGFDAEWVSLPASGVGAPHKRERWFCLAWPADADGRIEFAGLARADQRAVPAGDGRGLADALLATPRCSDGMMHDLRDPEAIGNPRGRLEDQVALMPTPRATDGTKGGPNQRGSSGDLMLPSAVALLPTPDANADKYRVNGDSQQSRSLAAMARREEILLPTPVNDMGEGKTPERWDEWTAGMQERHGNGNGHGKSLAIEAQRLFQTPSVSDATVRQPDRWGDYAAAIARWETVLGRPAPAPTMTSSKGNPQLSPRFTEWLMGLPDGWITDVPGVTRNEALKACGNGVVPQQCEAALRWLLAAYYEAVAA